MEQRLFIRLANRPPSKDPSLKLVQKAIQDSLWRLLDDEKPRKPNKFHLRDLQAMANLDLADLLSLPMPHQLDGKLLDRTALKKAIKTARDFLHFYQTENHKRLHQCQGLRKKVNKGLYLPCERYFMGRPNTKYCPGDDCKDNYWNREASVSGRARKAMRKHRVVSP